MARTVNAFEGLNAQILLVLRENDISWVSRICTELQRNPGEVHPAVQRLVLHGFLERLPAMGNVVPYQLTEMGALVADSIA